MHDPNAEKPALGFLSGIVLGMGIGLLGILGTFLLPDRRESQRSEIHNKLASIGLAFEMHHNAFGNFSQPCTKQRGTQLSWRVQLLPFLGHQQLYDQFHHGEPWDSPHNQPLLQRMPEAFRIGNETGHLTRMQVLTGPQSLFALDARPGYASITDGVANTILVLVTPSKEAIPWTKPDGLELSERHLKRLAGSELECLMADGQLLSLPKGAAPEILQGLATAHGGELIDADKLRQRFGPASQPATGRRQDVQDASAVANKRMSLLKQLSLAMHNYHDVFKQFPYAAPLQSKQSDASLKLSWRVHLLPFLDQQLLYERFHLNEPWDSPHNLTLLSEMPNCFAHPNTPQISATTRMMVLTGPGTPFDGKRTRLRDIEDGMQSTILIVECGYDKAVPWTKPEDVVFDAKSPVACLGRYDTPGFMLTTVDGAVRHLKTCIPPELFAPLATPAGKEVVSGELQYFGLWR